MPFKSYLKHLGLGAKGRRSLKSVQGPQALTECHFLRRQRGSPTSASAAYCTHSSDMRSQPAGLPAPRDKAVSPGSQQEGAGLRGERPLPHSRFRKAACLPLAGPPLCAFSEPSTLAQRKQVPLSALRSPLLGHLLPHCMRVRPSSVTLSGSSHLGAK